VLSRKGASKKLERLDARAEELIAQVAGSPVRVEAERRVRTEFADCSADELQRIFFLEFVKRWREKYRVPYLSYFYY
jgi:hypothetical protein